MHDELACSSREQISDLGFSPGHFFGPGLKTGLVLVGATNPDKSSLPNS